MAQVKDDRPFLIIGPGPSVKKLKDEQADEYRIIRIGKSKKIPKVGKNTYAVVGEYPHISKGSPMGKYPGARKKPRAKKWFIDDAYCRHLIQSRKKKLSTGIRVIITVNKREPDTPIFVVGFDYMMDPDNAPAGYPHDMRIEHKWAKEFEVVKIF
jgi:hypothetical protein